MFHPENVYITIVINAKDWKYLLLGMYSNHHYCRKSLKSAYITLANTPSTVIEQDYYLVNYLLM